MATLDSLPGDQRAVLQLVLGRGRSYDEIARLLTINPDAVRERAHAATDALGPQLRVPEANRQAICDYLLGQLPDHDVPAVREMLAHAADERAWAHGVREQLASLSAIGLPEIPGDTGAPSGSPTASAQTGPVASVASVAPETAPAAPMAPAPNPAPMAPVAPAPVIAPPSAEGTSPPDPTPAGDVASDTPASRRRGLRRGRAPQTAKTPKARTPSRAERRAAAADGTPRSSRRGGIVVIAVTVIVIAAVLIIVAKHHHSHSTVAAASSSVTQTNPASATQTSTGAASTSGASTTGAKVITQINLSPSTAGSKAAAIADVLQEGTEREVAIVGQDLPANTKHNSYEVWLYNSQSDAVSLGFVDPGVSANGKLSAAGPLPANASRYRKLVVTTETVAHPKTPGPIVLAGRIAGL
jgi:hypothetical protein